MPCRDYSDYDYSRDISSARKRGDELQANLCKAGGLIYRLSQNVPQVREYLVNNDGDMAIFQSLIAQHTLHRKEDKSEAMRVVIAELNGAKSRARKIRELGGEPKQDLLDEIARMEKHLADLNAADPLDTTLF